MTATSRLFSTDTDSGTITVLNVTDGQLDVISKIPVGNGPRGAVKFSSLGIGYVSNHAGNTISEIDAYSMRETARIQVGIAPIGVGLIPGDRYALVSNSGENTVSVVDMRNRQQIHKFAVGREPRHMDITKDGKAAYIAISGGDYIAKVDTSALATHATETITSSVYEIKRIHVGDGAMPYSVGISPSGKYAISANNQVTYISIIALESDTVYKQVDVGTKGSRGVAYSADGKSALVTIEDSSEVVAIDIEDGRVVNRFPTGPGPRGMVVDGDRIYAAAFSRVGLIQQGTRVAPNVVSVLHFPGTTLQALDRAQPTLQDIAVGAGPCSVSIFRV